MSVTHTHTHFEKIQAAAFHLIYVTDQRDSTRVPLKTPRRHYRHLPVKNYLPLIFIPSIFYLFYTNPSFCLRSSWVSCWHSASCLHGNQIHQPQIAPPNRISLRLRAEAPSDHITLLSIVDPSTFSGRAHYGIRIFILIIFWE